MIDRNNGMGFVRYILSLSVLIAHFSYLSGYSLSFPVSSYHAVGGFFALSGFLVYRSFHSSRSVTTYIRKRARKILPPYLFIVVGCAILMFFAQPLGFRDYFINIQWFRYLIFNSLFLNFLQPSLPGLFDGAAVNGSLWTIKIEWILYLSVPVVCCLIHKMHLSHRKSWILFTAIYVASVGYRLIFSHLYETSGKEIYDILSRQVFGQLCYFYSGVLIYTYYNAFNRNIRLWIISAIFLTVFCDYIPLYEFWLEPATLSIIVIGCSMFFKGRIQIFNKNNISYEMYLFHFPIIQLVCLYGRTYSVTPGIMLALSIILTTALSLIVWFCIDKPILENRIKPSA